MPNQHPQERLGQVSSSSPRVRSLPVERMSTERPWRKSQSEQDLSSLLVRSLTFSASSPCTLVDMLLCLRGCQPW